MNIKIQMKNNKITNEVNTIIDNSNNSSTKLTFSTRWCSIPFKII